MTTQISELIKQYEDQVTTLKVDQMTDDAIDQGEYLARVEVLQKVIADLKKISGSAQ